MTVEELVDRLKKYPSNTEIAILDGFNGGGEPRTINLGPVLWDEERLNEMKDLDMFPDYADLNSKSGTPIVIIGYGCY